MCCMDFLKTYKRSSSMSTGPHVRFGMPNNSKSTRDNLGMAL